MVYQNNYTPTHKNNQDRIQINGEWYVKENTISKETDILIGEDELIFEKKCTYENQSWLFEAYLMERPLGFSIDKSLIDKIYIEVTDKRRDDNFKSFIDENTWILEVIRDTPYALREANTIFDEEGLNYFKAFAQILVNKGWIVKK